MRVRCREHEPPDLWQVEPQGKLTAEHAAYFSCAPSGDDLDTAEPVCVRRFEEMRECVEAALGGPAVEVEGPRRRKLPGPEAPPSGVVDPRRLEADRYGG